MFVMIEIEHTLRLPPHLLNRPLNVAIQGELKSLFLDKVIDKLGLCVSVYDILSIDGGFIFPGDGASTYTARFRLVMFRPYVGEVISARLKESTEDGLRCMNYKNAARLRTDDFLLHDERYPRFGIIYGHFSSSTSKLDSRLGGIVSREQACMLIMMLVPIILVSLGFFDDIYVPVPLMPNPYHTEPDPEHKNGIKWVWEYMGENYPIDWTDEIRFRVHSLNYPPIPIEQGIDSEQKDSEEKDSRQKDLKPFAPMVITGSLDADGLGPTAWWV